MRIHPIAVRITHWTNAVAVTVMIASGWQIYNASPLFPFEFPAWLTLGHWLGGALAWHFGAMWLLAGNFSVYLGYGLLSGHIRRRLFPLRPREVWHDAMQALRFRLPHSGTQYNAVQRLLYVTCSRGAGLRWLSSRVWRSGNRCSCIRWHVDGCASRLEVSGLVAERRAWTLADLAALPQTSQISRHICIEGWTAVGKRGGVPFRDFLAQFGADTRARYVSFRCADDYRGSIDIATALHKQTLLALTFRDAPLPAAYGFPVKLRVPTKLGFKNPKHIVAIEVTNVYPGGFWEDYGYNWFSGS